MNERILVVDDEKAIADLVGIYLTKEGFDVQIAYSGADAAKAILEQEFDLALLDVMLPDIDGFELLRTIRSSHTYPVIMLTKSMPSLGSSDAVAVDNTTVSP